MGRRTGEIPQKIVADTNGMRFDSLTVECGEQPEVWRRFLLKDDAHYIAGIRAAK
jgi:hypothetical protein